MKFLFSSLLLILPLSADPLISSWLTELSGRYARIYPDNEALNAQDPIITWSRGQGTQAAPTYAGVSEVSATDTNVYIRSSGLGFHVMGPWFGETGNLFPNYPSNQAVLYRFPRTPVVPTNKAPTGLGAIGYFVDGIAMFDSRDAFSYDNSAGVDDGPNAGNGVDGDDVWNRDAFINESVTFDNANAHQAGSQHHYHANPPALRHLLGGSVSYDISSNTYTETPNGEHSPILGWVRDGLPIYGPYAYSNPTDPDSTIRRMISGYQRRDGSNGSTNLNNTGRTTRPQWQVRNEGLSATLSTNEYGPDVSAAIPLGHYLEDYTYKGDLSFTQYDGTGSFNEATHFDLNEYNVRWSVTPEFPNGTWAYFTCIEPNGTPTFPYNISRYYFANPSGNTATNIPATATQVFQGGPEKNLSITSLAIEEASNDITLVWSSVEGGNYTVFRSETLEESDWQTLSVVNPTDSATSTIDSERAANDEHQFYRLALNFIRPFDDTGFDYDNSLISEAPQNNVLLLIIDDWGIDASELYNTETGPNIQLANMPNLKNLAENGLLFTRGYAQPICSPTRATLLTGRHPHQHGVGNPQGNSTLPDSELTFPEIIATEAPDYGLASFGKWHLGSGNTGARDTGGWPNFTGTLLGGVPDYNDWERVKIENGILTDSGTDITDLVSNGEYASPYTTSVQVDEATSFINTQGSNPWVVWMGFNAPHSPFQEPPADLAPVGGYSTTGSTNKELYVKTLEALDTEIGRLLSSVNLATTNVIILGDNGSPGQVDQAPAGGIANAKGSLNEGGIHVPFFAYGPDIIQTGTTDELAHVIDLFATVLELTDVNVTAVTNGIELPSRSLVPIFTGTDLEDRSIISEIFNIDDDDGRALMLEQWPEYKLVSTQDINDPNDTPLYQMYLLGSNGVESAALTTPPNPGDAHEAAYLDLLAKDEELNQPSALTDTIYLEITSPDTVGPNAIPANENADPIAITVDGQTATYEARYDLTDTFNRFWVRCTLANGTGGPYTSATVTFGPAPAGSTNRDYQSLQIIVNP